MDKEFGEEVEKEMKKNKKEDESQEDEETKVELNEENQDILNKIFELHRFEKGKKITYIMDSNWKKKSKKNKKLKKTSIK